MAFQTGSQINPALGRIDYTPYMQGAVAGAQSIGQGIASLGQSVASGIEEYAKRKKENKMMEASLKANINSLEGLSKIASSLSPQAQEQFNSTMHQLNDPSVPLTDKVALSEAAQKTVGELINFGMQEKQKQEQALSQQLAYDAAVSGQSIPLIYPQSVRAPAAIQSLAIQSQLANIAETRAKTAAAGVVKQPDLSFQEQRVQAEVNAFTKRTGNLPNEQEMAQIMNKVASGSVPQPVNPYEAKVADQLFTLDQIAKAAPQQIANIDEQIKLLDEGKVNVGFLGQIEQGIGQIRALLGDKEAAKAVTNTQVLESALGSDLIGQIKSAGLTTRSFDTPKEMDNLRAALVGSTRLEPATLRQIAELRKKNLKLVIDDYNKKVKSGAYERMYSLYNQQPFVIDLGAPMVSPAPAPAPTGGGMKNIVVDY